MGKVVEKPEAGSVYKSYKGNLYVIIGRAIHTETSEEMVIYKSDGEITFVRPLTNFMDQVGIEGSFVPRFVKIWDEKNAL